jgi:hypothetical protein
MGRSSRDRPRSPRTGRQRAFVGLAGVAIVGTIGSLQVSAHRLDEYLQAARIALSPDRIEVAIDLTPGAEIAPSLRQTIDADRDGTISADEARGYAATIVGQLALRHDGLRQDLILERYEFPPEAQFDAGTGTIRLEASARPAQSRGPHQLSFENAHRPDVAVYLVNILKPSSNAITIADQRRDPLQRGIEVAFSVEAGPRSLLRPFLAMLALTVIALAVRRRAPGSGQS